MKMRYLLKQEIPLRIPRLRGYFFICALLWVHPSLWSQPSGFRDEAYSSTFSDEVGMTFDGIGNMYVWEKPGKVWMVQNGQKSANPVINITEEVSSAIDLGLLSVVTDPDFTSNGYIYLYYIVDYHYLKYFGTPSYNSNQSDFYKATIGRVTRYTLDPATNFSTLIPDSRKILVGTDLRDGIPCLHLSHIGGSLVFGEDGTLLLSTGDGALWEWDRGSEPATYYAQALEDGIITDAENVGAYRAQVKSSPNGKILRINPETGEGIPSNPYYNAGSPRSAESRIWAMGLRNPYSMCLKPGTGSHYPEEGKPGVLILGDVGWFKREEINVVKQGGQNFGWPYYEGDDIMYDDISYRPDNHTLPVIDWRGPKPYGYINGVRFEIGSAQIPGPNFTGASAIGGVWYGEGDFPEEYHNTYFFGDYAGQWMMNLVMDDNYNPVAVRSFIPNAGLITKMALNPTEQGLFYVNQSGKVRKVSWGSGNQKPVAIAQANIQYGSSPLTVRLDASKSTDPDGDPLTYTWNFGDNSSQAVGATVNHTFTAPNSNPISYTVTLTADDGKGGSTQETLFISLNNTPPRIVSTSLDAIGDLSPGEDLPLTLSALVEDTEHQGLLEYSWVVSLYHNDHKHDGGPLTFASGTTLLSALVCDPHASYWHRVTLTVRDPLGLSATYYKDFFLDCGGQDQVLSFPPISDQSKNTSSITLSATASSGLPVSFFLISGPAYLIGNKLYFTGKTGEVTIRAIQHGDDTYNPSRPVERIFNVVDVLGSPAITIVEPTAGESREAGTIDIYYKLDGNYVQAGANRVSFLVNGAEQGQDNSLDGMYTMQGLGEGNHRLVAELRKSDNTVLLPYAADTVDFALTTPPPPTVEILSPGTGVSYNAPVVDLHYKLKGDLQSVDADYLYVTLDTQTPIVLNDLNGTYSLQSVAPGSHTLKVQLYNSGQEPLVNPEAMDQVSFTVQKGTQSISIAAIPSKTIFDPAFEVQATSSSGLPVTLSVLSGPATLSGTTITLTGTPGIVTLSASQAGNESYEEAPTREISFEVRESCDTAILDKRGWTLRYVSSEETVGERSGALNAFDGNTSTFWHTKWLGGSTPYPHEIQIDLGGLKNLTGFTYLVRQDFGVNGSIKNYELYLSTDGTSWGNPVASGSFPYQIQQYTVYFSAIEARYLRLRALSEVNGNPWASASEIGMLESTCRIRQSQTLSFETPTEKYTTDAPFDVSATSGSGLTVTFILLSGPANLVGNRLTLTGEPGTIVIRASQAGNQTYLPVSMEESITVTENSNDTSVLIASVSHLTFDAEGSSDSLLITSNVNWELINLPAWIGVDTLGGSGNKMLVCTAVENTGVETRYGEILLQSQTREQRLIFIQQGRALAACVAARPRPLVKTTSQGWKTLVSGDSQTPLRGAAMSFWKGSPGNTSWAMSQSSWERYRDEMHFNAMRLVDFDSWRQNSSSDYLSLDQRLIIMDQAVQAAKHAGMYLIINYHDHPLPADPVRWERLKEFWRQVAPRYATETHVVYELTNELVFGKAQWLDATVKSHLQELHGIVRSAAPQTPVLFFAFMRPGFEGAVDIIPQYNFLDFTKDVVAWHAYDAGSESNCYGSATCLDELAKFNNFMTYAKSNGIPVFATEGFLAIEDCNQSNGYWPPCGGLKDYQGYPIEQGAYEKKWGISWFDWASGKDEERLVKYGIERIRSVATANDFWWESDAPCGQNFSLEPKLLRSTYYDTDTLVQITAPSAWTVSESLDWLSTGAGSGSGNATLNMHIAENTQDSIRSGNVVVQSEEGFKRILRVEQTAASINCDTLPMASTGWQLKSVSSQETQGENGGATNAFDGRTNTYWHTKWSGGAAPYPHEIQIDLGKVANLVGFTYLVRQDFGVNGSIARYEFYVSNDGTNWGTAVATGTFSYQIAKRTVYFPQVAARYVRLRALSEVNGNPWASASEIGVLESTCTNKLNQQITFASLPDKITSDAPFTLTASASSNLPVTYTLVSGSATLNGNLLTITGQGTIRVRADQAGNATYNPAAPVDRSFVVTEKIVPTLTLRSPSNNSTIKGSRVNVEFNARTGSVNDKIQYIIGNRDTAYIATNETLELIDLPYGAYFLKLLLTNEEGIAYSNREAADSINFTLTAPIAPSVAITGPQDNASIAGPNIAISYLLSGDLEFAQVEHLHIALDQNPYLTANLNGTYSLTDVAPGTHTLYLQLADSNRQPLTHPQARDSVTFIVEKRSQTITFNPIPTQYVGSQPFTLQATASSGLPVSFQIVSGGASLNGSSLTLPATTGSVTVQASQPGNAFYLPATPVSQTFSVGLIPDLQAPTAATNLTAMNTSAVDVMLSWYPGTDNVAIKNYDIYRNGQKIGATELNETYYVVKGLTPNTTYTFYVIARDIPGNISSASNTVTVRTGSNVDISRPMTPGRPVASQLNPTSLLLSWYVSADDEGLAGYNVYRNGQKINTALVQDLCYPLTGLTPGTSYELYVRAVDINGNESLQSSAISIRTPSNTDVEKPTKPGNLTVANLSATGLTLSWNASSDNLGVSGYEIAMNGYFIPATLVKGLSYAVSGLNPNTTYRFTVRAWDLSGNPSPFSDTLSVKTLQQGITIRDFNPSKIHPIWYDNDEEIDCYVAEVLFAAHHAGWVKLVGISTSASLPPYNQYGFQYKDWYAERLNGYKAALESGVKNLPYPIYGVFGNLIPSKDRVASHTPYLPGAGTDSLIAAVHKYGTKECPLIVMLGAGMTLPVNAWLKDSTIADKMLIYATLGSETAMGDFNGWVDGWSTVIAAQKLKVYLQIPEYPYVNYFPKVTKQRILTDLPASSLKTWMYNKNHQVLQPGQPQHNADGDGGLLAILLDSATYVNRTLRKTFGGYSFTFGNDAHEVAKLKDDPNGNIHVFADHKGAEGTEIWWKIMTAKSFLPADGEVCNDPSDPVERSLNISTIVSGSGSGCDTTQVSNAGWTLKYVSSEETKGENGKATNAFDGKLNTYWHTKWSGGTTQYPHEIQIDLGASYTVAGFTYLVRQDFGVNGSIARFEIYVSEDGLTWGTAVKSGTLDYRITNRRIVFPSKTGRYIRLLALSEVNGNPWASAAEFGVLSTTCSSKLNQTISFATISNKLTNAAAFDLTATASSGLPVSFSLLSGPATLSGNRLTLTGSTGTVAISAQQVGNTAYNAATPVTRSFTVSAPPVPTVAITSPRQNTEQSDTFLTVSYNVVKLRASDKSLYTLNNGNRMEAAANGTLLITGLTLGNHTLSISLADSAGNAYQNAEATASLTFSIVAPPLARVVISSPTNNARLTAPNVIVNYQLSGNFEAYGADHLHLMVDGPSHYTIHNLNGTYTLPNVLPGRHAIIAKLVNSVHQDLSYPEAADTVYVDVVKAAQTLTFPQISEKQVSDPAFTLSATATSGLTVGFELVSGPANISGNTLTLSGTAGTVVVRAVQSGNDFYESASPIEQSFQVTERCEVVALSPAGWKLVSVSSEETRGENAAATRAFDGKTNTFWHTKWLGGATPYPHEMVIDLGTLHNIAGFTYLVRQDFGVNGSIARYELYVSADGVNWGTAVSTGTMSYRITLQQINFTAKSGRYVRLRALSEVNGNPWASAAEIGFLRSTCGVKQEQTLTFASLTDKENSAPAFDLVASASSGLPVTFELIEGPATLSGNRLTLSGQIGQVSIRAVQNGNAAFNPAASVTRTFNVTGPRTPSIQISAPIAATTYSAPNLTVNYAVSNLIAGDKVVFTLSEYGPQTETVLDGTLAFSNVLPGSYTLTARVQNAASTNYANPEAAVNLAFTVVKADQTISFPAITDKSTTETGFNPGASASSGLSVGYEIVSGPATVTGVNIVPTGQTGTVVVRALQTGNIYYNAASPVERSFTVLSNCAPFLLAKTGWRLHYTDSEEKRGENAAAANAFDGKTNTFWHTQWFGANPAHPHEIQIDLGQSYTLTGFRSLPRQDFGVNGSIKDYEFYVSDNPAAWGTAVSTGRISNFLTVTQVNFSAKSGRYIRLRAISEANGRPWTSLAELDLLTTTCGAPQLRTAPVHASLLNPDELADRPQELQLRFYPNPTSSFAFLELESPESDLPVSIRLYNVLGGLVFTEKAQLQGYNARIKLSLYALPAGHYRLEVMVGDKRNALWVAKQ